MSGITPLIDTLLHQVLGKRVDVPPTKDPNAPVQPVDPGRGPGAVHSDSRLDARRPQQAAATGQRPATPDTEIPTDSDRPASTITRLSAPGARIAELLARFPAPPSALTSTGPLLTTSPAQQAAQSGAPSTPGATHGAPATTTTTATSATAGLATGPSGPAVTILAERLGERVRDSGLFYESHLNRWFHGNLDRAQLAREPQMWRALVFRPMASEANAQTSGHSPASGSGQLFTKADATPGQPSTQQSTQSGSQPSSQPSSQQSSQPNMAPAFPLAPWRSTQPAGYLPSLATTIAADAHGAQGASSTLDDAAARREGASPSGVHESLAPLVRHQLEMLATPVLRWEGDVWTGLFMALAIHPPQREPDHQGGGKGRDDNKDEEHAWRTELELELAEHGSLRVSALLGDEHLSLHLATSAEALRDRLEQGRETLVQRLEGHGFARVELTIAESDRGSAKEHAK
ncbi:flagellar hook-length control protein FliK [Halomonas litopenaei]|uniref:flagellar hook-length control protein FliK n=1 Tax=Halomonas litopenaei TaxID=2109328 RepID=UPI003F9FABEB